jgi:hypothetical protein
VDTLILDHHLLRSAEGEKWLASLCAAAGKQVLCAADYMGTALHMEYCLPSTYKFYTHRIVLTYFWFTESKTGIQEYW